MSLLSRLCRHIILSGVNNSGFNFYPLVLINYYILKDKNLTDRFSLRISYASRSHQSFSSYH
ncbi:hypothetical protein UGMREWDR_CDS0265 [Aeromonas phage GomatiRiver_11]|nr:hypothetical protein UGMREWDR_CDS0265 [Aeromonas phage GomatiRiver_11]